jgi:hypothetical protein
MKRFRFLLLVLTSIVFIGITGCEKEFDYEGTLEINSINSINIIRIYSLEDKTNPVYDLTFNKKKHITLPLNIGNYELSGYTTNYGYLSRITFQIRSNQTLKVEYNSDNVGKIINN